VRVDRRKAPRQPGQLHPLLGDVPQRHLRFQDFRRRSVGRHDAFDFGFGFGMQSEQEVAMAVFDPAAGGQYEPSAHASKPFMPPT